MSEAATEQEHDPADDFLDDPEDGSGSAPPAKPEAPPAKPADDDSAAGLKKALAAERLQNRKAQAKLKEYEQREMTDGDKAWQDKVDQTKAEAEAKMTRLAARQALVQAGLQGNPTRVLAMLDLNEASVTDDGELVGADDQIQALMAEFPGMFQAYQPDEPAADDGQGAGAPEITDLDAEAQPEEPEEEEPARKPGRLDIGRRQPAAQARGFAEQLARQIAGG